MHMNFTNSLLLRKLITTYARTHTQTSNDDVTRGAPVRRTKKAEISSPCTAHQPSWQPARHYNAMTNVTWDYRMKAQHSVFVLFLMLLFLCILVQTIRPSGKYAQIHFKSIKCVRNERSDNQCARRSLEMGFYSVARWAWACCNLFISSRLSRNSICANGID